MTFRTQDLPFASFLHSTRRLRFVACEPVNGFGRIAFVFDDPCSEGDRLHVEFEGGAECPPSRPAHRHPVLRRTNANQE